VKSEAEIRKLLTVIDGMRDRPCNCSINGHSFECDAGGRILHAISKHLLWVLGDAPDEAVWGPWKSYFELLEKDRAKRN